MIIEKPSKAKSTSTLDLIRTLPYDFYPTGSRFFEKASEDSDYDFFALNSAEIRERLKKEGFVERYDERVYNLHDEEVVVVLHKDNVDIQLVKDLSRRQLAVETMDDPVIKDWIYSCLTKDQRKYMWRAVNIAIALAEDHYSKER